MAAAGEMAEEVVVVVDWILGESRQAAVWSCLRSLVETVSLIAAARVENPVEKFENSALKFNICMSGMGIFDGSDGV